MKYEILEGSINLSQTKLGITEMVSLFVLTVEHCGVDNFAMLIKSKEDEVKEIQLTVVSRLQPKCVNN